MADVEPDAVAKRDPTLERHIDELYQLPLTEFTAARDALAKQHPQSRSEIRKLQKPNLPAWVVNQLYWHHRKVVDRLAAAAARLRAAHAARISGKATDIADVEATHHAAMAAALNEARATLQRAGLPATRATLTAVSDTLERLPWTTPAPEGRLSRELKPLGFEALAGMIQPGATFTPKPAEVVRMRPPARSGSRDHTPSARHGAKEAATHAAAEAAARREAIAKAEHQLHAAEAEDRQAGSDLEKATRHLDQARRRRDALAADLERAEQDVRERQADVAAEKDRVHATAAERARASARLDDARAAKTKA